MGERQGDAPCAYEDGDDRRVEERRQLADVDVLLYAVYHE